MYQGMTFGTEGPIMSGTWYHPATGDKFTVADTFFEDNQLLVRTTDGRLLNYNIIQNYIQQNTSSQDSNMLESNANFISQSSTPKEVLDLIEPIQPQQDIDIMFEPIGNLYSQPTQIIENINNNQSIVNKALSKTELPTLNVDLTWNKYPEREIEMLKDIMEIPVEDIIAWYVSKFDINTIKSMIEESINNQLNPAHKTEIESPVEESVTEHKESSVERKKTRKKQ